MITLIFAMDRNGAIGRNNKLPWRLPADLRFFKRVTMGHPVLMGRKTFESIGKPLPGRENVILTRDPDYKAAGALVLHSAEDAVRRYKDTEVFCIGGAEIFRILLPLADRMIVTHIDHEFEADTFFPSFDTADWSAVSREPGIKDEENPYDFEFVVYERVHKQLNA